MSVLTDLRNRGLRDVFFVVCDGLKGLPDVVSNVWPQAIVQTCIIHLIRNTFRLTSCKYWDEIKRDIKPIYTAVNATAARSAFDELADKCGARYPALIRLWDNAWAEFIAFLDYDLEIRTVICSSNAIESLNARYRRTIKARGHFPSEQAALKCLYLLTRSLDPTGPGRARIDDAVEASAQRVRDHLQQPIPERRNLLMETAGNTASEIDPVPPISTTGGSSRAGRKAGNHA
jgi:putative transposase